MGKIIQINPGLVLPSQTVLCSDQLAGIMWAYFSGVEDELPPVAIREYEQKFIAIDGHHRLAIADLLGKEVNAYVAEHKEDFHDTPAFWEYDESDSCPSNDLIHRRFYPVVSDYRNYCLQSGIDSFTSLRLLSRETKIPDMIAAEKIFEGEIANGIHYTR